MNWVPYVPSLPLTLNTVVASRHSSGSTKRPPSSARLSEPHRCDCSLALGARPPRRRSGRRASLAPRVRDRAAGQCGSAPGRRGSSGGNSSHRARSRSCSAGGQSPSGTPGRGAGAPSASSWIPTSPRTPPRLRQNIDQAVNLSAIFQSR